MVGLRGKATAMAVPRLTRRLCSAASTSGKKGLLPVSPTQMPSKPISSAERVKSAISLNLGERMVVSNFIIGSLGILCTLHHFWLHIILARAAIVLGGRQCETASGHKSGRRRSDSFDAHAEPDRDRGSGDNGLIRGLAGSAGVVEGAVRSLDSIDEGRLLQTGEVLVTTTTNVGWTPLFPRAAAIVTDVGAPLSHAAIVARELGVPAVVGAGDATMRLQTGDRVRVNGTRGTAERILS